MFRVTTLDLDNLPRTEDGKVDFSKDFFGKSTNLTVSGQLNCENFAMAFGDVYTFGPTFRAEVSYTQRHAAEFWMIEPEMAFADLNDYMDTAEADTLATYEVLKGQLDRYPDQLKNNVDFLANFAGRPKTVDYAGRLLFGKDGEAIISFGKHKGKTAREVYRTEPSYFA